MPVNEMPRQLSSELLACCLYLPNIIREFDGKKLRTSKVTKDALKTTYSRYPKLKINYTIR